MTAPLHLPSRSPVTVAVEAVSEVKKLGAAVGVLGENSVHAKALHEALRVARNKAKLPPIQEQLESYKTFHKRARKRVLRDRHGHRAEGGTVGGGRGTMQTRGSPGRGCAPTSTRGAVTCVGVAGEDRYTGEGARRSLEALRQVTSLFENIPPMPTTNVQELEGFIGDRGCELRNALEFGASRPRSDFWLGKGPHSSGQWAATCQGQVNRSLP